jgi:cell division transport system permease protein
MIIFYLSETLRLFRKSGYNSFILIVITSLAAVVSVASILLVYGVNTLDKNLKAGIKLNVFLETSLDQPDINQIEINLKNVSMVKRVEFISQERATEKFIKETGENFKEVLDNNPLPNLFIVSLDASMIDENNISRITGSIRQITGVSDVIYDYETTLKLLKLLRMIQYFFYPLAAVLVFLSIYLVYSNNKLLIRQNQNLFSTMNLVGGKFSSIRIPIILNGVLIGIISSIICILCVSGILILLTSYLVNLRLTGYLILINILISVISISLGVIGSFFSSRRIVSQKN